MYSALPLTPQREFVSATQPTSPTPSYSVAIVHDYLNQRGGAERVALELANTWPDAPMYTSLYRPDSTFPAFREREIHTTLLDHLPVDKRFRSLFPLYAPAFALLPPIDADVVIASSSGWGHLARSNAKLKIVYCHTPARWLYGQEHLGRVTRLAAKPSFSALRRNDQRGAARADLYVANSENVRTRIRKTYGIDSVVLHPPVDVDRFRPSPRGERLLVVSRLLPYKRIDLVIAAAKQVGRPLDIVGVGPSLPQLKQMADSDVVFHGAATDQEVSRLMEECWAVCVPGEEDFGIVAVEAQAAGKPVIAYGRGGSLESVQDGVTGVLFKEQSVTDVAYSLREAESLATSPDAIAEHAKRFSRASFREAFRELVSRELEFATELHR